MRLPVEHDRSHLDPHEMIRIRLLLYIILIALSSFTRGFSTFEPQCTLSDHVVNYVAAPDVRGSLNLVWACIGVLATCVYTVLHYDLPWNECQMTESQRRGFLATWLKCEIYLVPVLTVLAPELVYGTAFIDWFDSWIHLRTFRKHPKCKDAKWSIKHIMFMDMSGHVLLYRSDTPGTKIDASHEVSNDLEAGVHKLTRRSTWNGHESDSASGMLDKLSSISLPLPHTTGSDQTAGEMEKNGAPVGSSLDACSTASEPAAATEWNDIMVPCDIITAMSRGRYRAFVLTPERYLTAVELGIIPPKPMNVKLIEDRALSDAFAKVLLILSLFWFFINIIGRLASRLPVSALEVGTTAFAICSTLAYGFLFQKPRGVETPIAAGVVECIPKILRGDEKGYAQKDRWSHPRMRILARSGRQVLVTYVFGICFGAIHLMPWKLHFASTTDAKLWQAAAIIATTAPALLFLSVTLGLLQNFIRAMMDCNQTIINASDPVLPPGTPREVELRYKDRLRKLNRCLDILVQIPKLVGKVVDFLSLFGIIGYIAARFILVVEMIRGLFYLTPEIHRSVRWANAIPHIN
jgi:hypothetical protein